MSDDNRRPRAALIFQNLSLRRSMNSIQLLLLRTALDYDPAMKD